jgi:pimeloyl-ACP methyl ester carboxylesterase
MNIISNNRIHCILFVVLTLVLSAGLSAPGNPADSASDGSGPDWTKLEGKKLRDIEPDEIRVLNLMARVVRQRLAKEGGSFSPQARALARSAGAAFRKEDYYRTYRYVTRAIISLAGEELSETTEIATSLNFVLNRALLSPGDPMTISLQPAFTLGRPLSGTYTAKLSLRDTTGKVVQDVGTISITEMRDYDIEVSTASLKPGRYLADYELLDPNGDRSVFASRRFVVHDGYKHRLADLEVKMNRLEEADVASRGVPQRAAMETIAFVIESLTCADKQYISSFWSSVYPITMHFRSLELDPGGRAYFDVDTELGLAEKLAAGLLAGKNPFQTRTGDMRLAYRSSVDGELVPFRVFAPDGYDPAKKYPMIVGLHGANGDEHSFMEGRGGLFKRLGQERGYILATPSGRGPYGGYEGAAEKDVIDVTERVMQLYSVDPARVFLTGHSMGGQGTWYVGFNHPDTFAALAPIAGTSKQRRGPIPLENKPDMPVLFSHGAKDTVNLVENARLAAETARKSLSTFQYDEYPECEHNDVVDSALPVIFDFFDQQWK